MKKKKIQDTFIYVIVYFDMHEENEKKMMMH